MSGVRHAGIGCSVLALAACATSAVTLEPEFSPPAAAAAAAPGAPAACTLRVLRIEDVQPDPDVLGQIGPREVLMPADRQRWLRSVMAGLGPSGIRVEFGSPPQQPGPQIEARVTLESAWVASLTTAKTASVVLAVQYLSHGVPIKSAHYRGSASEPNWSSGSGEIQDMVDEVIQRALVPMAADVRAFCKESRAPGTAAAPGPRVES